MYKKLFLVLIFIIIFAVPSASQASVVSNLNAQIQNLLRQIALLQQKVNLIQETNPNVVTPTTNIECPTISRNLWYGTKGQDVSLVQQFLRSVGTYTYPIITGYYGSATLQAVQNWQARVGIVNYGSPYTTGFGVVGPKTRSAMAGACGGVISSRAGNVPIINKLTGPTTLRINQTGTWIIDASDPQNGSLSYSIDWGDSQYRNSLNSTSNLANSRFVQSTTLTHSYKYAGTYTVSITVRDNQNLTAKVTTTVRVVGTTPTNTLSASPTSGNAPLAVRFSGSVVGSSGYSIDFGDGATSGDVNCANGGCPITNPGDPTPTANVSVTHTYTSVGTYTAKLRRNFASNEANCFGVDCNVVATTQVVVTSIPITPATTFYASPTSGNAPLAVIFSGLKSAVSNGGSCPTLEFGDGTVGGSTGSCTPTFNHTYTSPGTYIAKLYKNIGNGIRNLVGNKTITVLSSNTGILSTTPTSGNAPLTVTFTSPKILASYFGGVAIDYGEGAQVKDQWCGAGAYPCSLGPIQKTHTYTSPGTYNVKLSGLGEGASVELGTATIVVN